MSSPAERRAPPRAAFLGPAGTFSEEALLASARPDAVEPVPCASIHETVIALREGDAELALVPIENSLEGSIDVTLDLLAEQAAHVQISGEALLRVRHALIASAATDLGGISTVLSHPAVPAQCTRLLRGELAHAEVRPASSTAEAVRSVAEAGDPAIAALGTVLAAQIYGGTVLREDVQDRDDNETRFVWLTRDGGTPPLRAQGAARRCSIVFWGAGTDHAGWLVGCLGEFASREINLTKIESRPRRGRLGTYMFFADLDADAAEPAAAEAIGGLRQICDEVRVLGSYASAAPAT